MENKKETIFYKCEVCGNIIVKLNDSGITPYCCSHVMTKMSPDDLDGDLEFHVPTWKCDDNKIIIKIGEKKHPMTEEHHIEWIFLKTNLGFHVKFLASTDDPEACFKLCHGEEAQFIFTHCNIHGLWKACINKAD